MANQDDFEKLISDMSNAETPNEFMNTLVNSISAMLTADVDAAKKLYATDVQLQSIIDTQVNLEAYCTTFINVLISKLPHSSNEPIIEEKTIPVAERLAAGEPRSYAHAAVQGSRGAEVLPPAVTPFREAVPIVENPAEIKENG